MASWLFCHPKRATPSSTEAEILATGHRFWLEIEGHQLATWSWGQGPTVVLHHGWGGCAGQMAGFVNPLIEAGFSVLAYDAPAHGESPGRITSAPEMAKILRAIDRRMLGIHAVVAHSLGCAVTLMAIGDGLQLDRAVLMAPPSDLRGFPDVFASYFGIDSQRLEGLGEHAAARFGANWQEMHVGHWRRGANPPLLIFHDRQDDVLELHHAEAIERNWRHAELVVTEKLGHRRIRLDTELTRCAVDFLASPHSRQREGRGNRDIERELVHREAGSAAG